MDRRTPDDRVMLWPEQRWPQDVGGPRRDGTRPDRDSTLMRRHPLAAYVVLAFALSWAYWIPLAVAGGSGSHVPGLLGPMAAGLIVTAVTSGRAGLRGLLGAMGRWRVTAYWYAAAAAPVLLALATVAMVAAAGFGRPTATALGTMPGLPVVGWLGVFALVVLINGYGEEVGWRGVAWPRLRQRHSLPAAALLLTVPWALWHLPVFWLDTGLGDFDRMLIPGWLLGLTAGSVVLGWLYERTGHSLLLAALFHASVNMASATEATAGLPATVTSAGVILAAVVILRRSGKSDPAAQVRFDGQVLVRCSPTAMFDLLANVDRYATHPGSPVVAMERIPPADSRVGTRWREVIRIGPFVHMTVWSEVVALAEPYELVVRFHGPGMRGTLRYAVEPVGTDQVLLHQHQRFATTGWLRVVPHWLIRRMFVPRAQARLRAIRDLLEAQQADRHEARALPEP